MQLYNIFIKKLKKRIAHPADKC